MTLINMSRFQYISSPQLNLTSGWSHSFYGYLSYCERLVRELPVITMLHLYILYFLAAAAHSSGPSSMPWSCGRLPVPPVAPCCLLSPRAHPAHNHLYLLSVFILLTVRNLLTVFVQKYSVCLSSVVLPVWRQELSPSSHEIGKAHTLGSKPWLVLLSLCTWDYTSVLCEFWSSNSGSRTCKALYQLSHSPAHFFFFKLSLCSSG